MLRFVLCDDNEAFLNKIAIMLDKIFIKHNIDAEISKLVKNPVELLEFLETNTADVIILDVKLNSALSGIEVADKIRKKDKDIYIIFITGHFEYSMLAYKVKTFDFLIKPISAQKLEETILRLYEDMISTETKYMSFCKGKHLLRESEILYIEKNRMKAIIHTNTSTVELYSSLNKLKQELPNYFIRCNKSFLVNTEKISRIDNKNNTLYIGDVPIVYSKNFINVERMINTNGKTFN